MCVGATASAVAPVYVGVLGPSILTVQSAVVDQGDWDPDGSSLRNTVSVAVAEGLQETFSVQPEASSCQLKIRDIIEA